MKNSIIIFLFISLFIFGCTKNEDDFESSTSDSSNTSTPSYLTDSFVKGNMAQGTWIEYNIYYTGPNGFYNTNSDPSWQGRNLSFNATEILITNNGTTSTETYTLSGLVLYSSSTFQNIKVHMEEDGKKMFFTNTNVSYQAFNRSVTEFRRN